MRYALVFVAFAGSRALAQPVPLDPATQLFVEGRELLDAGKPAEACTKFEQSYALDATAVGAMLNLGICHEQQDQLATALVWYRRTEAVSSQRKLVETAATAKQKATLLVARVATLTVKVKDTQRVTIDGNPIDAIDFKHLEVDAGHHVLAAGTIRSAIDIVDGQHRVVELVPVAAVVAPVERTVHATSQRRLAYIVGGIGLGFVAGSAVLGLVGKHEYDNAETPDGFAHWKNIVRFGATSLFVVGAAAVSYGAVVYVRAHRVEVAPVVGRDGGAVTFATRF